MRSPLSAVLIPVWLMILFLAGCGGGAADAEGDGPVDGGTAVIAFAEDPDILNPLIYQSASSGQILVLLQEGLVEMGEDLAYHPHIAREWIFSPDSLTVTVPLRPWTWSDGRPVTAQDVTTSFSLYMDPLVASPRSGGRLANIAAVTARDSATVVYEFRERRAGPGAAPGDLPFPPPPPRGLPRAPRGAGPRQGGPPGAG
nr:hypothetical protein [bacterium]